MDEGRVLAMSGSSYRALILTGDGINCELETAEGFRQAGFDAQIRHLNDLIAECFTLDQLSTDYHALAIPGGFSFADDIASGRVLALKIQHSLRWNLLEFAQRGGLVLGICNGFQALIRLGLFGRGISITTNQSGRFENRWVKISRSSDTCVWLKRMGTIELPIRNGEGKICFESIHGQEVVNKLNRHGMSCLKYESNPNGSAENLAGICDPSGRVLGLMPHPEAFLRWTAHPEWTYEPDRAGGPGEGLMIFQNAFQEVAGR